MIEQNLPDCVAIIRLAPEIAHLLYKPNAIVLVGEISKSWPVSFKYTVLIVIRIEHGPDKIRQVVDVLKVVLQACWQFDSLEIILLKIVPLGIDVGRRHRFAATALRAIEDVNPMGVALG